jgi:hypothetical protein
MSSRTDTTSEVSIGAGIAILGAWLGGAGLTTMILLIIFVWSHQVASSSTNGSNGSGWILILLIAAPMIAAFAATKMILNKD